MKEKIKHLLDQAAAVKNHMAQDEALWLQLASVSHALVDCFKKGGKVLFCGNGGSAADAQHLAAELSGRFYLDRAPLFAEALHVNTSFLTAVANDYGYEEVFARMVRAAGKPGDILIGLSTSGKSPNILKALQAGRQVGMQTIGMTGAAGQSIADFCDFVLMAPSTDTPRIQEAHITMGHIFCQLVEQQLFEAE
ncbi:MAG: D-sedoheptulose 7-phosphate isomerase [Saprospiraceae bacterium]|nr:D-sedoheptulose 7-phosphate isomerase [Saprospiraceae bacterium]